MSRRSDLDKGSVTGGLVNEAYNTVKKVADELDAVIKVADNLSTLSSFSVTVTADVGDGTVSGDMDAMDWTGHEHADTGVVTALKVEATENLIISHKGIIYNYSGTKPTLLGIGGTATVASDYSISSVGEHSQITGRDAADSHPISAITGLQIELDTKSAITYVDGQITNTVVYADNADVAVLGKTLNFSDGTDGSIGSVAERASKFLGFDALGDIIYSAGTVSVDAVAVNLTDLANNYDAVNVEDALAELGTNKGGAIIGIDDVNGYFPINKVEDALKDLFETSVADRANNVTLIGAESLINKVSIEMDKGGTFSGTVANDIITLDGAAGDVASNYTPGINIEMSGGTSGIEVGVVFTAEFSGGVTSITLIQPVADSSHILFSDGLAYRSSNLNEVTTQADVLEIVPSYKALSSPILVADRSAANNIQGEYFFVAMNGIPKNATALLLTCSIKMDAGNDSGDILRVYSDNTDAADYVSAQKFGAVATGGSGLTAYSQYIVNLVDQNNIVRYGFDQFWTTNVTIYILGYWN